MNPRAKRSRSDGRTSVFRRDFLRLAGAGALTVAFGRSRPAFAWPVAAAGGTIYVGTDLRFERPDGPMTLTLVAIDAATGKWRQVLERCGQHPRISPDGRRVAFAYDGALRVSPLRDDERPVRLLTLRKEEVAEAACWSADGERLAATLSVRDEAGSRAWRTLLLNRDGSGQVEIPLAKDERVQDWSPDGQWLLTKATRDAKSGPRLYVTRVDGSESRAITAEDEPYYARFSPDGRRVVYMSTVSAEETGVWLVDVAGGPRREVLATGSLPASACWSPDGKRLALAFQDFRGRRIGADLSRVESIDLEGKNRVVYPTDGQPPSSPPDWR